MLPLGEMRRGSAKYSLGEIPSASPNHTKRLVSVSHIKSFCSAPIHTFPLLSHNTVFTSLNKVVGILSNLRVSG